MYGCTFTELELLIGRQMPRSSTFSCRKSVLAPSSDCVDDVRCDVVDAVECSGSVMSAMLARRCSVQYSYAFL